MRFQLTRAGSDSRVFTDDPRVVAEMTRARAYNDRDTSGVYSFGRDDIEAANALDRADVTWADIADATRPGGIVDRVGYRVEQTTDRAVQPGDYDFSRAVTVTGAASALLEPAADTAVWHFPPPAAGPQQEQYAGVEL